MAGVSSARLDDLTSIRNAIRGDAHILATNPRILWQQIHNRLQWEPGGLAKVVEATRKERTAPGSEPWIRTLIPAAESAGYLFTLGQVPGRESASFSRAGTRVVTCDQDDAARIWDVHTGRELATLETQRQVTNAAFTLDDSMVVTLDNRRGLVWDASGGALLEELEIPAGGTPGHLAVHPSGDLLATLVRGELSLWDARTRACLATFSSRGWHKPAFSPEWEFVSSRDPEDQQVATVWRTRTGEVAAEFAGHTDWVQSVCFSPDGTQIATGSDDGTARLWDLATGECLQVFDGGGGSVGGAMFDAAGRLLATASADGVVRLWDAESGAKVHDLSGPPSRPSTLAFTPDGSSVAAAGTDGVVRIWSAATGALEARISGHVWGVDFMFGPDGARLVTVDGYGTARMWDTSQLDSAAPVMTHPDGVAEIATDPRNDGFVTIGGDIALVWQPSRYDFPQDLQTDAASRAIAITPNGSHVLIGTEVGDVEVWSTESSEQTDLLESDDISEINDLAIAADGRVAAAATESGSGLCWDLTSGELMTALDVDTDDGEWVHPMGAVAVSPAGSRVATGDRAGFIRVWDPTTGQLIRVLDDNGEIINCVAFVGEGILTGTRTRYGGSARLWDVQSGDPIVSFSQHTMEVVATAVSKKGSILATASDDATARLWDFRSGDCLHTLERHEEGLVDVAFLPGDRSVVTAGGDSTRVWDVATGRQEAVIFSQGVSALAVARHDLVIAVGSSTGAVLLGRIEGIR